MQRQGDLLLIPTEGIPLGAAPLSTRVVLEGEHCHRLDGGRLLQDPQGQLFVCAESAVQLLHEEHGSLQLGPGTYRVQRQRQYRPAREEHSWVED